MQSPLLNRRLRIAAVVLCALCLCGSMHAQTAGSISRPVGFIRVAVPTGELTIASIPFEPFDASINELFKHQLVGPTNVTGSYRILRWDRQEQEYERAVKPHGPDYLDGCKIWLEDGDNPQESELMLVPGEAFWIESASDQERDVYLCGEVILDDSFSSILLPGLNLIGNPFPSEVALTESGLLPPNDPQQEYPDAVIDTADPLRRDFCVSGLDSAADSCWVDGEGRPSTAMLMPGSGHWYERNGLSSLEWSEPGPFAYLASVVTTNPCIVDMYASKSGNEIGLVIECTGETGESIDVFTKEISPAGSLSLVSGWCLADTVPAGQWAGRLDFEDAPPVVAWTDGGQGLSMRSRVNTVFGRCYAVGRADVDSDQDGIPDAREIFIYGTNPQLADTDGDKMPDGFEVGHGLNPVMNDGALDDDKDGATNLDEYRAGTDPRYARHEAATIFVDADLGDDEADGLSATNDGDHSPKRTIKGAFRESIPGDSIVIEAGEYREGGISVPGGVKIVPRGRIDIH